VYEAEKRNNKDLSAADRAMVDKYNAAHKAYIAAQNKTNKLHDDLFAAGLSETYTGNTQRWYRPKGSTAQALITEFIVKLQVADEKNLALELEKILKQIEKL
jgi:hypothetical protein